ALYCRRHMQPSKRASPRRRKVQPQSLPPHSSLNPQSAYATSRAVHFELPRRATPQTTEMRWSSSVKMPKAHPLGGWASAAKMWAGDLAVLADDAAREGRMLDDRGRLRRQNSGRRVCRRGCRTSCGAGAHGAETDREGERRRTGNARDCRLELRLHHCLLSAPRVLHPYFVC